MKLEPNFKLTVGTYSVMKFPSGEIQVKLDNVINFSEFSYAKDYGMYYNIIEGSILSSDHLMELLQLVEAIRHYHSEAVTLNLLMPYCAYSRQDRRCNKGESLSSKVFANIINSCNFDSVVTLDNHSDTITSLINNCTSVSSLDIFKRYNRRIIVNYNNINEKWINQFDFLVSPDAGANKKVFDICSEFNIPMIRADKRRDVATGKILETIVYATPKELDNKNVLIVDDICQGGRTFEELAKAIKATNPTCTVNLYVTHGFFDKGLNSMVNAGISKFYTTDSVLIEPESDILKVIQKGGQA